MNLELQRPSHFSAAACTFDRYCNTSTVTVCACAYAYSNSSDTECQQFSCALIIVDIDQNNYFSGVCLIRGNTVITRLSLSNLAVAKCLIIIATLH